MHPIRLLLTLATALVLATACKGADIPADKSAYIGQWRGNDMRFELTPAGMVHFKRRRSGGSTEINLPLQAFEGPNLTAGLGPASTTFVVTAPPHQVDGKWTMTVDGVEVCRDN